MPISIRYSQRLRLLDQHALLRRTTRASDQLARRLLRRFRLRRCAGAGDERKKSNANFHPFPTTPITARQGALSVRLSLATVHARTHALG